MFPIHIGATAPSSCTRRAIMEKAAGAPDCGGDAERVARLCARACVCVCVCVWVCVCVTTCTSTVANTFCVDSRTAEAGPIPARPPTPSLAGLLLALRGGRPFGCPALPFVDDVLELVVYNNGLRTRLPVSFFV